MVLLGNADFVLMGVLLSRRYDQGIRWIVVCVRYSLRKIRIHFESILTIHLSSDRVEKVLHTNLVSLWESM